MSVENLHCKHFETTEPGTQFECAVWLIENKYVEYEILNLSNESEFCTHLGNCGLQENIFSKLEMISELILCNCSLDSIPDLTMLKQLRILNLKNNHIAKFEIIRSKSLEELNLEGNPVVGFYSIDEGLPSLRKLNVGSSDLKISFTWSYKKKYK